MPDLETISKEQLYAQNLELRGQVIELQFQLDQLKRLVFGQTRERFVPSQGVQQPTLFSSPDVGAVVPSQVAVKEENAENGGVKKKGQKAGEPNPNHKGRNAFPAHLPRVVNILVPELVSLSPLSFTKIGQEITETLDYEPAKLFVLQRVREKYVVKSPSNSPTDAQDVENTAHSESDTAVSQPIETDPKLDNLKLDLIEGVLIAPMPDRPLPKAIAEAGFLAQIMVDKFVDHLPVDRQTKRWKRESNIDIKGSTIVGWTEQTCQLLMPLYQKLSDLVFDCTYLQADETTLKSLENAPKGKTHTSYQWVYRNVEKGLILFDYQRHRAAECLHPAVKKHQGYLQTDGYAVYDALSVINALILMNCLAHARREFFDAKQNDAQNAEIALAFIQKLYKIEEDARKKQLNKDEIFKLRQEKCPPILIEFKDWLQKQIIKTLPKSPIGQAMAYTLNRWDKLTRYIDDGTLEIDNNRIENAIRPLALGRKNYLFVGADEGGKRAAMMYSFFATCHAHNVNPLAWLTDVLKRIPSHPVNKIEQLLPHLWAVREE